MTAAPSVAPIDTPVRHVRRPRQQYRAVAKESLSAANCVPHASPWAEGNVRVTGIGAASSEGNEAVGVSGAFRDVLIAIRCQYHWVQAVEVWSDAILVPALWPAR